MTKKKHEELVEEIGGAITQHFQPYPGADVREADEEFARELITLILSAVREGRLDEELGVVSRIASLRKGLDVVNPMAAYMNWLNQQIIAGADILIALHPLEGKEEEKNGDGSGRPD